MKSFFSSRTLKIKVLATLGVLGVTSFSLPTMAVAKNTCVRTSRGDVVCGELIQEQSSKEPSKESLRAFAESYIGDWGTRPQNGRLLQVSPIKDLNITKTSDPIFPYHGTVTTEAYPTLVFSFFYYDSNRWITESDRNRIRGR
jgi:hypothetical protein